MGIRGVIFDYGMVLTGAPDKEAHDAMVRITGLTDAVFEVLYWADRHAYDEGKLTGAEFWEKFARDSGIPLTAEQLAELNRLDARMWTTCDKEMLAWQRRLKASGIRTAILSNMGDSVLANMKREFKWLDDFDALVWSFEEKMAKPEPEIYRRTLERLGTRPEETLFVDDRRVNVEAARALGMKAIEFSTPEKLREQLVGTALGDEVPLP